MKTINKGFERLRQVVPYARDDRRHSKVETLRLAIEYIRKGWQYNLRFRKIQDSLGNSCYTVENPNKGRLHFLKMGQIRDFSKSP